MRCGTCYNCMNGMPCYMTGTVGGSNYGGSGTYTYSNPSSVMAGQGISNTGSGISIDTEFLKAFLQNEINNSGSQISSAIQCVISSEFAKLFNTTYSHWQQSQLLELLKFWLKGGHSGGDLKQELYDLVEGNASIKTLHTQMEALQKQMNEDPLIALRNRVATFDLK